MKSQAKTPEEYLSELPETQQIAVKKLRQILQQNLPEGFEEIMQYGMISFVVPHNLYPQGYHCDPKLPLPFISLAGQKNFIALYHMGIYQNPKLYDWFVEEYGQTISSKLDMGKSCIRFKKPDQIPYDLIAKLAQKMSVQDWILAYKMMLKK